MVEYPINPTFAGPCDDCERVRAVVTVELDGFLTDLCRRCADWHARPVPPCKR